MAPYSCLLECDYLEGVWGLLSEKRRGGGRGAKWIRVCVQDGKGALRMCREITHLLPADYVLIILGC